MKSTKVFLAMLAVLMLSTSGAQAALNGTYSINSGGAASASNYLTLTSAITDMVTGTRADGGPANGPGVSGPVTLRIAAGTGPYNEQLSISAIPGASATNTVRITGGPTRATVQFTGTTTTNRHVFQLNGCKHVTLDSLTITNNDATYGYGVWLTNNADSNKVMNSVITVSTTATSTAFTGITLSGTTPSTAGNNGDYNLIQGNTIIGGYYGISNNGTSTTVLSQGNQIINNTVRDFYFYGIRNYYQDGVVITGNTVYSRATATTSNYGMYLYYNDRFTVQKNLIYNTGTYGIYLYAGNYQNGTGGSRAQLSNNMIGGNIVGATTPYGIYVSTNTTNVDFWHNSVSLTSGNGRAMYMAGGSGNDVRNNIFSVTGSSTGYAFYSSSLAYFSTLNNNDYWCPGSSNFIFMASAYTTSTYIGGGGFNTASVNVDPAYVNSTNNLHVLSNSSLYDAGANVGVMDDYDGQTRPLLPSVGYDIGADEFTMSGTDAGAFALTSPLQPFGAGVQNVGFTLKNFGVNTLTSATLNWQINGVSQTPYAWTGSLATNAISAPFTVGTNNFLSGNTYVIKAWTSSPNGGPDASATNDTITTSVCTGLSGTYTIGPSGDFATINSAVSALQCGGVAGPVTFNLIQGAGPFNEQVIIPQIPGASATKTIRFNGGANRETVQFTGTTTSERAVIKLNGADHVILDSLTIINNDATYANGLQLTNNADSNIVRNCIVNVSTTSTSSNFAGIVIAGLTATTAGDNGDGNLIENNSVSGGYYGITQYGTSSTVFSQNNRIINNNVANVYYYGIQSYYQNLSAVNRNSVRHRSTASTAGYSIYLAYNDRFEASKNRISNGGSYGMYVLYGNYQGGSSSQRALISNNMIGGQWLGTSPYGIYFSTNCVGIDVVHNTVSMTSGNGRCIYVISGSGNAIRNNSFAYFGSSTGYAAYISNVSYIAAMDYNNYYAPGSSNFMFVGVAYSPTTYVGGGGFNLNSKMGDPFYVDNNNDLHAVATQLFDAGDPTVGITTDIDDEVRPNAYSSIPDIGADEYLPDTVNIMTTALLEPTNFLCPDSNQVVKAVIFNKGLNTISNIAMTAEITGALTATLNMVHPGPIAAGLSDTVTIGYVNTWPGGTLLIKTYNTVPNDQNLLDDTLFVSRVINQTPNSPTVTGQATVCQGDSVTLIASALGNNYWYDANQGGTLLHSGDTLQTGPLSNSMTYYVESRGQATASLTTTFAGGNGCSGGNMFDVYALQTITIDSFDLHLNGTATSQVDVYYKTGSYAGFETNSSAWTLLGSMNVTSAGPGLPTRLPLGGITIPSGQTYAIYIFNPNVAYTTLSSTTTYTSPEMQISSGVGLCSLFGGLNNPRGWNGRVYYQAEGCASPRTPVTLNVNAYPTVSIADSSNCGPITLDAGNSGATYNWNTGATTQTITATNSGTYTVTVSNGSCARSDSANLLISTQPSVSLPNDSLLCNGAGMVLDAGNNPGADILWSTGDTTQSITVNAAGTYVVNLMTPAGCNASDSIVVTTLNAPVGNIGVDTAGCPTVLLTGNNAGGPAQPGAWDFGDLNTGTGTSVTHTYASNGTYSITYTQGNACGTDVATSVVTITCIVGTVDPNGVGITLYPNPTRGDAMLKLTMPTASEGDVTMTDLHGRIVRTIQTRFASGSNQLTLEMSDLSAGVYLVQVRTDAVVWEGKIVKE